MTSAQRLDVPGRSWVHRLDPVTKIVLAVVAVALTFVLPSLASNVAVLAVCATVLVTAGVWRQALAAFAGALVLTASLFVVQGLAYPGNLTPAVEIGPVTFYREGLVLGLRLVVRLHNIFAGTLILILTTRPADLVEALVRRGLPARAGYVVTSVVQILPTVTARLRVVRDAQRSRGVETGGGLWPRLRAIPPLVGPVVAGALIATEERALALEVRGFSATGRRTFLRPEERPPYATAVRAVALGLALLGVVGRVWLGWR